MKAKKWTLTRANEAHITSLSEQMGISRVQAKILVSRGIQDPEAYHRFINPSLNELHDPWLMKDMAKAVDRIMKAIHQKEKILIFGDYDVDGTTAVALFYQFIIQLHSKELVDFYIPHRFKEGYGLSNKGIDHARSNGQTLIITLDCGIKSVDQVQYGNGLGIDFIICDHHLPGPTLPDAVAILNPKQADCNYPYKELCGCGIGFKFASAIAAFNNMPADTYLRFLDLVATAIAADIVPMTGENRILAFHGMKQINSSPSTGIRTIIELEHLKKELSISNVVFIIAPRVNAAGRMDDARKAVMLFIEEDPEKAKLLGASLQKDNTDRKEADLQMTAEALEMIKNDPSLQQKKSCVLYHEKWNKGVVGIVASRVIEHYYRPTIILTKSEGILTGSARSIKDFNLYEAIYECRDHLLNFGGHFAAAGLSLKEENLPGFIQQFENVVSASVTDEMLVPDLAVDAEIDFTEINYDLYNLIKKMDPFGPENMKPFFVAKKVKDRGYSKLLKEQHIKFDLLQERKLISGIGFKMPDKYEMVKSGVELDILFTLEENEYNGNTTLQLHIIDCRISE